MRFAILPLLILAQTGCVALVGGIETNTDYDAREITEPFSRVEVDLGAGDLRLEVIPGSTPFLERDARYGREEPTVILEVEDEVLRLRVDCPMALGICQVDHDLSVPAGVPVYATLGSGEIVVDGWDADLDLTTSSGSMTLSRIDGEVSALLSSGGLSIDTMKGDLVADLSSGSADLYGIEGDVHIDLRSGGLDVEEMLGDLTATLSSGSADVEGLRTVQSRVESSSGGVSVQAEAGFSELWLDASSGSIAVEVPSAAYRLDLDASSGSVRVSDVIDDPSAAATIRAHTSSGGVDVKGY